MPKRYPVPANDGPPLERAIGTHIGVVFFTGTDGGGGCRDCRLRFTFRRPKVRNMSGHRGDQALEELVTTWPARTSQGQQGTRSRLASDAG